MKHIIKNILLEFTKPQIINEEDKGSLNANIFPEKFYKTVFKMFDKLGDNMMEGLENLSLDTDEDYTQLEKETNIVYKYFTEYADRKPHYIPVIFSSSEIADFFYDGEYGIKKIVKDFLVNEWDFGYDYDCFDVDDWLIRSIDERNMNILKELYLKNLDGEENEEDFKEFIETEHGSDIGCAAGDAQFSADIDSLRSDIFDSINDYLDKFNGKLVNKKDNEGRSVDELEYVGEYEIGELAESYYFESIMDDMLSSGYPKLDDIFWSVLEAETSSWPYGTILPDEKIRINEDRHFRYGGNGNIDWEFFNDILYDKLSYY